MQRGHIKKPIKHARRDAVLLIKRKVLQACRKIEKNEALVALGCFDRENPNQNVESKKDLDIKQAILLSMLKDVHRVVRHGAKEDMVKHIQDQAEEAQAAAKANDTSKLFSITKQLPSKTSNKMSGIRLKHHSMASSALAFRQRWQQFFAEKRRSHHENHRHASEHVRKTEGAVRHQILGRDPQFSKSMPSSNSARSSREPNPGERTAKTGSLRNCTLPRWTRWLRSSTRCC